jgi:hypothetical protein
MRCHHCNFLLAGLVGVSGAANNGSLLFLEIASTSPYSLGLQALSLSTLQTSSVLVLGPSESFFDMAAASASDGNTFYTTIQHPGPPIDPNVPSSHCSPACGPAAQCCEDPASGSSVGTCFAVSDCSKINQGHSEWAETLAVSLPTATLAAPAITARMNTSACIKVRPQCRRSQGTPRPA